MDMSVPEDDGPLLKSRGELLRETIACLKAAYHHDPAELEGTIDVAVRSLVRLRDKLIEESRQTDPDDLAQHGKALRDVNAALSLIVGVDYPAAGIKRELMKKAEQLLKDIRAHDHLGEDCVS
jgi:hypothetical protein